MCGLLRPRLSAEHGATVAPLRDDKFLQRLPYVTARAIDGDATRNLAHVTTAEIDIQCWARKRDAADELDDLALEVLLDAKRRGTVAANGRIAGLEVVRLGSELRTPNQPGDVYRWQASYSVSLRRA